MHWHWHSENSVLKTESVIVSPGVNAERGATNIRLALRPAQHCLLVYLQTSMRGMVSMLSWLW